MKNVPVSIKRPDGSWTQRRVHPEVWKVVQARRQPGDQIEILSSTDVRIRKGPA